MKKMIWLIPVIVLGINSCSSVTDPESEDKYEWHENALRYDLNSENPFIFLHIIEKCDDSLGTNCQVSEIISWYSTPEISLAFNEEGILSTAYFAYLPDSIDLPVISVGDTIEILDIDYGPEPSDNYTTVGDPNIYYRYFVESEFTTVDFDNNTLRKLEFRIIHNRKIVFYLKYEE